MSRWLDEILHGKGVSTFLLFTTEESGVWKSAESCQVSTCRVNSLENICDVTAVYAKNSLYRIHLPQPLCLAYGTRDNQSQQKISPSFWSSLLIAKIRVAFPEGCTWKMVFFFWFGVFSTCVWKMEGIWGNWWFFRHVRTARNGWWNREESEHKEFERDNWNEL